MRLDSHGGVSRALVVVDGMRRCYESSAEWSVYRMVATIGYDSLRNARVGRGTGRYPSSRFDL